MAIVPRRRRFGLGDAEALPAGLVYSTIPGHEGDVVNTTSDNILWNGSLLPPGYGTEAWWGGGLSSDASPAEYQAWQDDPNNPGGEAWAWNQTHGHDAATLADMQTWSQNGDGSWRDPHTGANWKGNVYSATLEILALGSQPYSHELAASFNDAVAAIWRKYDMNEWAAVSSGDPAATAAWVDASQTTTVSDEPERFLINGLEQYADGTPVPDGYNALEDLIRQQEAAGVTPGVVTQTMVDLVTQNPALLAAADVDPAYKTTFATVLAPPTSPAAPGGGGGGGGPWSTGGGDVGAPVAADAGGGLLGGLSPVTLAVAGLVGLAVLASRRGRR